MGLAGHGAVDRGTTDSIRCGIRGGRNRPAHELLADRRGAEPQRGEGFKMRIALLSGLKNRILQTLARLSPGVSGIPVWLHRWRAMKMGKRVWIGYDAIIETERPYLVEIRDGAAVLGPGVMML